MKKKVLIILGILVGIYLILDVGYYVTYKRAADAYQKCVEAPGSSNIEPDPPTCWYADGTEVNALRAPSGLTITIVRLL